MRALKLCLPFLFALSSMLSGCLVDEERNRQLTRSSDDADDPKVVLENTKTDSTGKEIIVIDEKEREEMDTSPIRRVIQQRRNAGVRGIVSAAKLRRLVPDAFRGFKAGDVNAESINLKDRDLVMSFVDFKLRNSGRLIEGNITDLNGAPDKLISAWKAHNLELDYRSTREFNLSYRPNDWMVGFENIMRNKNEAIVSVLVDNRFVIELHGYGFKDADFLKELLRSMQPSRLKDPASI
ncbi:MAG: hypothetical protein ACOCZ8_01635 [Bacteroidota bacterium]